MNRNTSPLESWREIVHPIFWPVFFWNLRAFVRTIRELRALHGDAGELAYGVTWWGAIRIERIYPEPEAAWDGALEGCARRVHVATLDVLNPHLSPHPQIPAKAGIHGSVSLPGAPFAIFVHGSPPSQGPAGLFAGAFPNLPHLNTS